MRVHKFTCCNRHHVAKHDVSAKSNTEHTGHHFSREFHNTLTSTWVIFTHTPHRFASEVIDSSTGVIWVSIVLVFCGFWSINFEGPINLHYIDSQRWIIRLFFFICVHLKKKGHIHPFNVTDTYNCVICNQYQDAFQNVSTQHCMCMWQHAEHSVLSCEEGLTEETHCQRFRAHYCDHTHQLTTSTETQQSKHKNCLQPSNLNKFRGKGLRQGLQNLEQKRSGQKKGQPA